MDHPAIGADMAWPVVIGRDLECDGMRALGTEFHEMGEISLSSGSWLQVYHRCFVLNRDAGNSNWLKAIRLDLQ